MPIPFRLLKSVARISAGVLIGATLFLVIFEKRLIYYPATLVDVTPGAFGLPFQEVLIEVEPGVRTHRWFIKAKTEPIVATVLISHGNAGTSMRLPSPGESWLSRALTKTMCT